MNIYSLSVLLFSFGVLLIAILSLAKRRDAIAIRSAFFSISVCGWGFLYSIWTSQNYDPSKILFLIRFSEIFAAFIPMGWLHFILEFIGKKEPFRHFYAAGYLLSVILAAFCPTSWFFTGVHPIPIFHYYKTPGPVFYVFLALFFTAVPYAFYHLIHAYRRAEGQTRSQLGFLLAGWLISFLAGAGTFLPAFKMTTFIPLLCLMPLYPIFVGIALIRYGLFDFDQLAKSFQREKLAAIGTMAASLNHELRNPLFIAKGKLESHLDAVERGLYQADPVSCEVLQNSLNHLMRAMDIMQRFSDFAKPFGSSRDREEVVVKDVFDSVLPLVSNEFEWKKIRLAERPENGVSVHVNRRQLEEVFLNLMINACHAMGDKGGELKVTAAQPNGKVIIEISDTGPGIPKENQRRIFEPFYSTKGEKGSGLGLYITKQLVERNGGKISVKSRPGQGAKFTLEFRTC